MFRLLFTVYFFSITVCLFSQSADSLTFTEKQVVITGEYAPSDTRSTLHSARVITAADIQRRGAVTIADVLSQEANIRIQNDPVLGSSIMLNGLSGRNIKFLLNGVPMVGRQNGNIDLSQLNVLNIQRIEIIEGPMALMYGSDAIAGVVNIITKQYQAKKLSVEGQIRRETRALNTVSLGVGSRLGKYHHLRVAGGHNTFRGWAANDSSRNLTWKPKRQQHALLGYTYDKAGKLKLQLMGDGMQETIDNKGEIRRPQFRPYAFDDTYLTRRLHGQFSADMPLGQRHFVSVVAGAEQYHRQKNSYRTDIEADTSKLLASESDTSIFNMQMLRLLHQWNLSSKFKLKSGLNVQYDQGLGKRFADSTGNKTKKMADYALFSSLQYYLRPNWSVEAGLRAGYNSTTRIPLIPSIHSKYQLDKRGLTIRASYSQGFRAPEFKELYFQFIDLNHNITGSTQLKPENAHNFLLNVVKTKSWEKLDLQANARFFFNDIQNKIELYEYKLVNGEKVPVTDTTTLLYSYFNIEKYQTWGSNLSLRLTNDWLQLGLNVSPVAYLNPDHKKLQVSRYNLATNLQTELGFHIPKTQTSLQTYHNWNDKQISYFKTKVDGEEMVMQRVLKGFLNSDVVLMQKFWKERLTLSMGARNLWNVKALRLINSGVGQGHLSDSQTNFGPGRSYWVQLGLNW